MISGPAAGVVRYGPPPLSSQPHTGYTSTVGRNQLVPPRYVTPVSLLILTIVVPPVTFLPSRRYP